MQRTNRPAAERRGRYAESFAAWALRLKGYRLLARRFKTPLGEVDLIMRRGEVTAFIEVKARRRTGEAIEHQADVLAHGACQRDDQLRRDRVALLRHR